MFRINGKVIITGKINEADDEHQTTLIMKQPDPNQFLDVNQKEGGYQGKDTTELQSDLDNDEEYEQRKGIASYFQKMFRKNRK